METPILSIKEFSKSFGTSKIISNLSFDVHKGEIFAFLGPNGSGKTTTIRSLLGIYTQDSGELLINGQKYSPELSSVLGYLPEERGLYTESKVLELMIYFGRLKGMTKEDATSKSVEFLNKVELADKHDLPVKKLSSGQQQKIQLGITIINTPELLILDEPTKGLDPINRTLLLNILKELNEQGTTIMLSSHQMELVEQLASRMMIINYGDEVLYGNIQEIKESYSGNIIQVTFDGDFIEHDNAFTSHIVRDKAIITPHEGVSAQDILKMLVQDNLLIKSFAKTLPSLNEVFITAIKNTEEAKGDHE